MSMESKEIDYTTSQNFIYSASLILKVIYEASQKNQINKEEKLKLKFLINKKHPFIEELKDQYIKTNNAIDWFVIKEKLNTLLNEHDIQNVHKAISSKFKPLKKNSFQQDTNDSQQYFKCIKSNKKNYENIASYDSTRSSMNNLNNNNIFEKIEKESKIQFNSNNIKAYKISFSKGNIRDKKNSKVFSISENKKMDDSCSCSDSDFNLKSYSHAENYIQGSSGSLRENLKNISQEKGDVNTEGKESFININLVEGDYDKSLILNLSNDSIYILKNFNDDEGFVSDEEAKNLSTTVGIDSFVNNNFMNIKKNLKNPYLKSLKRNFSECLLKKQPSKVSNKNTISWPINYLKGLNLNNSKNAEEYDIKPFL